MTTLINEIHSNHYNDLNDTDEEKPWTILFHKIRNIKFLLITCFLLFAMILPFLLYLIVFDSIDSTQEHAKTCLVDKIYRLPCGVENISAASCENIFGCFERKTNSCYHSEPSNYYYYRDVSNIYSPSIEQTPLGLKSLKKLNFDMIIEGPQKLRFIVNGNQLTKTIIEDNSSNFDIHENESNKLSVSVFRKNTNEMLLTTSKGPLIASEEYLDWTFQLTNTTGVLFGFGELKINLNENSTMTKVIYKNQNDHNTLPVFMAYNKGKYHAAVISHEGALRVTVLPSYLVSLRMISGGTIEIQLLDGPTPMDIYGLLKRDTNLVPEWGLGVHLCREEPAEDLNSVLKQYNAFVSNRANYPEFSYESDCIHDDLLLHLMAENYTTSDIAKIFKKLNMKEKFILSYSPQIPINSDIFEKYKNTNLFYKNDTTGEYYIGKYKDLEVVFPNYKDENITNLISDIQGMFKNIKQLVGFTFTSSWPQDDSYQMGNSSKPYIQKNIQEAFSHTLPWDLNEGNDTHLRYHNEYGPTVQQTVKNQSPNQMFSFSSVSDMNSNEPLIVQNINTSWTDLKKSLHTSLYNSLFGHTLINVPVCGSNFYDDKLYEDLCLRWYLVAATMPLVRISSKEPLRDPTNLYTKATSAKVIEILNKRNSLVPFYRTILNEGEPIVRPMFFDFPTDENVHSLDEQYMIGGKILVAHPMSPDIEFLKIYLPPDVVWYEFWGGIKYFTEKKDEWIKFPIFKGDWVSFVLEGNIIPQVSKPTNGDSQITLTVAMKCHSICRANGSLLLNFPDENVDVSVNFTALEGNITITSNEKCDVIRKMINRVCIYTYENQECNNSPQNVTFCE